MRKLKLQMQITLDGFVAGPEGQGDWIWLNGIKDEIFDQHIIDLADSCDTILLGRKTSEEFIPYWENVVENLPDSPEQNLAQRMVNMSKIIFSRTQTNIKGKNARMENGDLITAVQALKKESGKDIMVYGGAGFANALISNNLVDEYLLFRNPVAIGNGLSIFHEQKLLKLDRTTSYVNGKVLNEYRPV